jgi:cytochrome c oxidase assembly factor CtaG
MNSLQKATLWVVGCLVLVFALSIGLSWYQFGYLDWATTGQMALMLLPVLAAAAVVLRREEKPQNSDAPDRIAQETEEQAKPAPRQEAAELVGAASASHERR